MPADTLSEDEAMRRAVEAAARLLSYPEASDPAKEEHDAAKYTLKAALGALDAAGYRLIGPIATHEVADAFWKHWRENGETHKHGYYESTWGAISKALDAAKVKL